MISEQLLKLLACPVCHDSESRMLVTGFPTTCLSITVGIRDLTVH